MYIIPKAKYVIKIQNKTNCKDLKKLFNLNSCKDLKSKDDFVKILVNKFKCDKEIFKKNIYKKKFFVNCQIMRI